METKEISEPKQKNKVIKITVLILGSFLVLWVSRAVFINQFDSAIVTRFACVNHAKYLNEQGAVKAFDGAPTIALAETEFLDWSVDGHNRSNKLGIFNRDSARCLLDPNLAGQERVWVPMSEAHKGNFYYFGKLIGIVLQLGLVSTFIRWYNYRFG